MYQLLASGVASRIAVAVRARSEPLKGHQQRDNGRGDHCVTLSEFMSSSAIGAPSAVARHLKSWRIAANCPIILPTPYELGDVLFTGRHC